MKILIQKTSGPVVRLLKGIPTPGSNEIIRDATTQELSMLEAGMTWYDHVTNTFIYPPSNIPKSISNWRAKAVIELAGLTSQVEAALAAMTGSEGIIARAAWNGNADFDRHGTTVTALSAALGLTPQQVDDMFIQAASLSV